MTDNEMKIAHFELAITCLGLKVLNMAAFLVLAFSILEYLWNEHERKKIISINQNTIFNLLLQYLTLIGKPWKTHPEIFLKSSFSGSSYRPFYWNTHPLKIMRPLQFFFSNLGRHTDRFTGKLIHSNFASLLKFILSVIDYQLLNFFLRKEIRPRRERLDYRSFILRVDRVFVLTL